MSTKEIALEKAAASARAAIAAAAARKEADRLATTVVPAEEPVAKPVAEPVAETANIDNEYDEEDEEEDEVNLNYDELNTIADGSSGIVAEPSAPAPASASASAPASAPASTFKPNYQTITKDTVHQQIFVNSGMLGDLGSRFNCQINFRRKDGRYALFVRPNDTNYMFNATNGFGGENNQDRLFFNISLKQDSRQKIRTEYMSGYVYHDGEIKHSYQMGGKPATIKKNRIDLET